MDRKAVFTAAFNEFLESQKQVTHETRTQRRFKDEATGGYKYTADEWTPVREPNFKQEIIPQTLTNEDLKHDRWPAPCYRFTLANGQVIETFVQRSREFLSHNLTVDFLGLRLVNKTGKGENIQFTPGANVDELCWGEAEMNEFLPQIVGNAATRGRTPKALEVREPNPVNA